MMWTNILTIECLITIHEQWCTHFVQELQGFEPSDRDNVFIFYASALRVGLVEVFPWSFCVDEQFGTVLAL